MKKMEKQGGMEGGDYPTKYLMCFNDGCTKAEECTHHVATQHIRPEVVMGMAVYPTMKNRMVCPFFKKMRTIRAAWGFDAIFKDVKQREAPALRAAMKAYLGGNGQYYRYHHGELLLTPEQQKWIVDLFKNYGYSDGLAFDHYVDTIDW